MKAVYLNDKFSPEPGLLPATELAMGPPMCEELGERMYYRVDEAMFHQVRAFLQIEIREYKMIPLESHNNQEAKILPKVYRTAWDMISIDLWNHLDNKLFEEADVDLFNAVRSFLLNKL